MALLRSAADERVRALVTWGAAVRFGSGGGARDGLAAARTLRAPWLVVHGAADAAVPADDARALHAAAHAPSTRLVLVPGADHAFGAQHPWAGSTPALERAVRASIDWLGRHLA